ncbi:hypothetical protein [Sulfurimonas sp.]
MLEKIKNNIEAYLLILVSVILFVVNSFGFENILGIPIDETTLLTLILAMLSMIYYKLININTENIDKKLTTTNIKFDDLLTISKGKVSAIEPKKEPHIWNNFVGDFYAVNAPWKLEENIEVGYEKIIDEYIDEYANEKINNVYYVFYESSNYPKAIDRFSKFIEIAMKKSKFLKEKIKVIVLPEQAPEFSLFFGYKTNFAEHRNLSNKISKEDPNEKFSYSIIYIGDKPFINKNGMPSWSFVSVDNAMNNVIENYIEQLVHNNDEVLTIEEFLKKYKKQQE